MLDDTPAPVWTADRHAATAAIGTCLAGMYSEYLRSPIPEQLTLLVAKIDACKNPGQSAGAREQNHE